MRCQNILILKRQGHIVARHWLPRSSQRPFKDEETSYPEVPQIFATEDAKPRTYLKDDKQLSDGQEQLASLLERQKLIQTTLGHSFEETDGVFG